MNSNTVNNSVPNIASLDNGGYIIVWRSDGAKKGVYTQQFDQNGLKLGSEILVSSGYKERSDITILDSGEYIITWQETIFENGPKGGYPDEPKQTNQIYFQRYTSYGEKIGLKKQVNSQSSEYEQETQPSIESLNNGGFVIVWNYSFGDGYDQYEEVMLQQYESDGSEISHYQTIFSLNNTDIVTGNLSYITDPDEDILSYSYSGISNGVFTIDNDGKWKYQPNSGFDGDDKVTITVSDGRGGILKQSLTFHVKHIKDFTVPVIKINGGDETIVRDENYIDKGAVASDNIDGTIEVVTKGTVDTNVLGEYIITYTASDSSGNVATATRKITVVLTLDTTPPVITINGGDESIEIGRPYFDKGSTAKDDIDGTVNVVTTGTVDTNLTGTYIITYTATDLAGNTATVTRTVTVIPLLDITPPVITLNGGDVTIQKGGTYNEEGATATDGSDGVLDVVITGSVDTNTPDSYTITYTATDTHGNVATATRVVTVEDEIISSIEVLSPSSGSQIIYSLVTIEVSDAVSDVTAKNLSMDNTIDQIGIKSGNKFLIYNLVLQKGENEIEISANSGTEKSKIILNSEGKGIPPVSLELDQTKAFGSLITNAKVNHTYMNTSKYLIETR